MKCEILAVGTELLLGDILNTDAQYISKRLADMGINVYRQSVVGDNEKRLLDAYEHAFKECDMVITSGGLGPTKDDLTKEVGAKYFGKQLVLDQTSLDRIYDYFNRMNIPVNEGNKKQAYLPEGCIILENNNGTAPGCIIEEKGKVLIMLPGPPKELCPMFEESVVPYLSKFQEGVLYSEIVRICGIGEGHMAEKIGDIIDSQTNPTVAPYAKDGQVILRITARAKSDEEAKKMISPIKKQIYDRLGDDIYGEGENDIEDIIGEKLVQKKLTISTAESCTGGLLAGRLINYPGISKVFMQGAVTYSNEAKMQRLGVKKETLEAYGAVSPQTAVEMARGIAETSGCDIGVSTTGIAGPTGGTKDKPVGLVYVGLYVKGKTSFKRLDISGSRRKVRDTAVIKALDFLRRNI